MLVLTDLLGYSDDKTISGFIFYFSQNIANEINSSTTGLSTGKSIFSREEFKITYIGSLAESIYLLNPSLILHIGTWCFPWNRSSNCTDQCSIQLHHDFILTIVFLFFSCFVLGKQCIYEINIRQQQPRALDLHLKLSTICTFICSLRIRIEMVWLM